MHPLCSWVVSFKSISAHTSFFRMQTTRTSMATVRAVLKQHSLEPQQNPSNGSLRVKVGNVSKTSTSSEELSDSSLHRNNATGHFQRWEPRFFPLSTSLTCTQHSEWSPILILDVKDSLLFCIYIKIIFLQVEEGIWFVTGKLLITLLLPQLFSAWK